ncbi:MAG: TrkA family potassium uptake protein [Paramuribaculum sp.]|nr:TrkA family potassium uptake protein [Paramuribaculum sp.]
MRYLIIGLGIYGSNLAMNLADMGHEVIGADINPTLVEGIKDNISTAYIIDSTDEASLSVLPLKNVDLVIVAIGENFGASIRTVAVLKKMQVPHIYARAIDALHESILKSFEIDRILTPEQRAAKDLVHEMELGVSVASMSVDKDYYILKFAVPAVLEGERYSSDELLKPYGLKLVAAMRPYESRNILGVRSSGLRLIDISAETDETIEPGDVIVCMGTANGFRSLFRVIG